MSSFAFAIQRPNRRFPDRGNRDGGNRSGAFVDPKSLKPEQGVATIPDRKTFEKLSYQGPMRMDAYLSDLQFVKFIIAKTDEGRPIVYWMNTKKYQAHPFWMRDLGMSRGRGEMRGAVTYLPRLKTPDGQSGLYIFDFQPNSRYSFKEIRFAETVLLATAPFLKGKLAFHPLQGNLSLYENEKDEYAKAKMPVHLDGDLFKNIGFLPLNSAISFGRLTVLKDNLRPSPRDVVICELLPNEMPRVAGVISAVRQTPLSHVNLRAIQDKIPNAFVVDAMKNQKIKELVGKPVRYEVSENGYSIREATQKEIDDHFKDIRPKQVQVPERDLSSTTIRSLNEIAFEDSKSLGVKTANLAAMHQFKLPENSLPNGHGIPFSFYDEFMKHNGLYQRVDAMFGSEKFKSDRDTRVKELKKIQKAIEAGDFPEKLKAQIAKVQKAFPEGTSIRCRSSTNNEDLPGFSGAGLYDSFTHKPDEGHLAKSIKQVYASLWNLRAFEEREFYRIDHKATAMGVLLHPNFKNEIANGVAVTTDVLYGESGNYYVNAQVGEDLVTNPEGQSVPEEILLGWWERDGHRLVVESNRTIDGKRVISDEHLKMLRKYLGRIHSKFAKLYKRTLEDDDFAMEIEFKIDKEGRLVIKQARPWVFTNKK